MPELPEVETVRRGLIPWLTGRTIAVARRVDAPAGPKYRGLERAAGQTITAVTRRGKFIVMPLSGGDTLVVHLGMTGVLGFARPADHLRVEVLLEPVGSARSGRRARRAPSADSGRDALYFRDPRRFGRFVVIGEGDEAVLPTLAAMGPEPLGEAFSLEAFSAALARRAAGIKTVLLSQRVVAGVGNIYADEVLWRCRLHPERRAATLTRREVVDLHAQIREVLAEAIADGGTTLRDYRQVEGGAGTHQEALGVYGRAGLPCPRCGEVLTRLVVGQRGTTLCPVCQPRSGRAGRRA